MTPHDEVLGRLLSVLEPRGGELRLLGRIADPVLGNDSGREVFFFVPDLHIISPERRRFFGDYGFNHEESGLLADLLVEMADLREAWEETGRTKLVTVQLGDFFDLWREFGRGARPEDIADGTHGALRDALYRGVFRGKPCLRATMLLGNHDTKRGVPLEEVRPLLKAFNRSPTGRPFLFTTHGDAFDQLEALLPDAIQEFVVEFLGSLTPVNKYTIESWGRAAAGRNKPLKELREFIMGPEHGLALPAGAVKVVPGVALPEIVAQREDDPEEVEHNRFPDLHEAVRCAAETFPSAEGIRLAVVGHSHHAAMILCRPPGGRPLAMMDVGSWIEDCRYPLDDGSVVTEPCAQLGVVHGNDARIYQVRMP